jgi:hypothetical protein
MSTDEKPDGIVRKRQRGPVYRLLNAGFRAIYMTRWRLRGGHARASVPAAVTPSRDRPAGVTAGDDSLTLPLSALVDLAIEAWRLERWLSELDSRQSTAAGRFVARRVTDFVAGCGLETVDMTGQPYEPGLAVELLGHVQDITLPPGTVLVDEMVAPLCLWHGKVVRMGQVVTRSASSPASSGDES